MEEKEVMLSYYQVLAFMSGIDELEKSNPDFNDEIAKSFQTYVVMRTKELVFAELEKKGSFKEKTKNYKITKNILEYLTRLTNIDVFDRKTIKRYIEMAKNREEQPLFPNAKSK